MTATEPQALPGYGRHPVPPELAPHGVVGLVARRRYRPPT